MTELVHYPKADPSTRKPGTWMRTSKFIQQEGIKAYLCCRKCGFVTSIRTHTIDADGTIKPSLVCPIDSCNEHVFGILENWSPAPAPTPTLAL